MSNRYNQRGVSASKEDVHAAIKNVNKGLFPNAFCKVIPDILGNDPAYCNVMHADGAGTKSSLAYMYWKETGDLSVWQGIAQDAIVMNTDDLLCVGITDDILLSSTIGRNKNLIPGEAIKALILQALAHEAHGDGDQALVALSRALTLANPGGYVRAFIDEGVPIEELLRRAVARRISANYAGILMAALEVEKKPFYSPLVEPLSERALEVLRLLTTSMTSAEIAGELFISVHTVRSHIKTIYGKLGVHRRMEAVVRTGELDLI
jgi:DNA-binding CsgD family transcriptional regulator